MDERPEFRYTFLTAFLVLYGVSVAQNIPAFNKIREAEIRGHVEYLASTELQGREAGTAGGRAAGSFTGKTILEYGLQPAYPSKPIPEIGNYFQKFNITGAASGNITSRLTFKSDSENLLPQQDKDYFYLYNQPNDVDLTGDPVFCGYGIVAPEYGYNDFGDKNLEGKIAVAYYGEPLENDSLVFFNGKKSTSFADPAVKARQIFKRGGKALILIPTPENGEKYQRFLNHTSSKAGKISFVLDSEKTVPVIFLSAEFARRVFPEIDEAAFNMAKKRLSAALQRREMSLSLQIQFIMKYNNISLKLRIIKTERRICRNIIAILPGTDPVLKNEYILIGSHYDHEGIRKGQIFRGADDNASGVAANLALAEAYAHSHSARSIIFAFWDAEEKGMLGSHYFADNPPVPLQQIKAVFNMDMIGRDASFNFAALRRPVKDENAENKVMIFYSAQTPELRQIADQANEDIGLELLFDPNVFFTSGSDHTVFQENHIPVLYFFTGFHTDYSSPGDTPDKIDYNKLTRITRHIANFVYRLGNMPVVPEFDSTILTAPEGDFRM